MMRAGVVAAVGLLATPRPADACGGYVAQAETETARINDAIELVVARDGTRTYLSVRNRYRGPVEDFAILIPVPQVLHEEDVETLDPVVFDTLNELTSPEMETLTELDPCAAVARGGGMASGSGGGPGTGGGDGSGTNAVHVEAKFTVGEYDIEVLSAKHAASLTTWLTQHGYKISKEMAPLLRPYVDGGSKFFVAKVDPKRVEFVDGVATLSPLRFRYDSEELSLPLRLSTANSPGTQDVLIHVVGPNSFEAANRPNVKLPPGLQLAYDAPGDFSEFYVALVTATLAKHPGAVIEEYVGLPYPLSSELLDALGAPPDPGTITRLHLRLDKTGSQDDLVLRDTGENSAFHPRYYKITPWTSAPRCANPDWGRYDKRVMYGAGAGSGTGARSHGFGAPIKARELGEYLFADAPTLDVTALRKPPPHRPPELSDDDDGGGPGTGSGATKPSSGGCCDTGGAPGSAVVLVVLVLLALPSRRGPLRPRDRDDRAVRV